MDEAKYHELEMWGWDCPKCKYWNETGDDPGYDKTIFCEECAEEFIPVSE